MHPLNAIFEEHFWNFFCREIFKKCEPLYPLDKKLDFWCSDFTYGIKKDHNVENQNINYQWHITYGYQGLWGPGGLG
jgi:hypothetical protein